MTNEDKEAAAARSREKEVFMRLERHNQEAQTAHAEAELANKLPLYEVRGIEGKHVVIYSRYAGRLVKLPATTRMTAESLFFLIAPPEELLQRLPDGVEPKDERELVRYVRNDIASRACKFTFSESMRRGAGVWKDDEGLLYTDGRGCWLMRSSSDKLERVDVVRPDGMLYASENPPEGMPRPADSSLTDDEGQALYDCFSARAWVEPHAADLLAGLIPCAMLAGALDAKPYFWITGRRGSGKSVLCDDLSLLFGNFCHVIAGAESSDAGFRRLLEGNAMPLLFDEAEADGDKRKKARMQAKQDLLRPASSGNGKKASVRAKEGGGVDSSALNSAVIFFAIRDSLDKAQDISRNIQLHINHVSPAEVAELRRRQAAGRALMEHPDTTARLIVRVMQQYPYMMQNAAILAERLEAGGMECRRAKLYAMLFAGRWAMTNTGTATEPYFTRCVGQAVKAEEAARVAEERESEKVLQRLLMAPCMVNPRKNVRQCALFVKTSMDGEKRDEHKDAIEAMGFYPRCVKWNGADNTETWVLMVDLKSEPVKKLLEGTPWDGGKVADGDLHGEPWAKVSNRRLRGVRATPYPFLMIHENYFSTAGEPDEY